MYLSLSNHTQLFLDFLNLVFFLLHLCNPFLQFLSARILPEFTLITACQFIPLSIRPSSAKDSHPSSFSSSMQPETSTTEIPASLFHDTIATLIWIYCCQPQAPKIIWIQQEETHIACSPCPNVVQTNSFLRISNAFSPTYRSTYRYSLKPFVVFLAESIHVNLKPDLYDIRIRVRKDGCDQDRCLQMSPHHSEPSIDHDASCHMIQDPIRSWLHLQPLLSRLMPDKSDACLPSLYCIVRTNVLQRRASMRPSQMLGMIPIALAKTDWYTTTKGTL